MKIKIALLATVCAVNCFAENTEDFSASYQESCSSQQQGLGLSAEAAAQKCSCLGDVLAQEASADEQKVFLAGNFTVLQVVEERSAQALQTCEQKAPVVTLKSGANTYASAKCKHWIGTTWHSCKRTITGGHAWCFMRNDNLNPGDVLCKDAPGERACTEDTVQFGIIPTLLPKEICTFN